MNRLSHARQSCCSRQPTECARKWLVRRGQGESRHHVAHEQQQLGVLLLVQLPVQVCAQSQRLYHLT